MEFELSFDDGNALDLKLADLIEKYKLQKYTTFYIPTNCELINSEIKELSKRGFEIGGHTVSHPSDIKLLPKEQQYEEIVGNKDWLENVIKKKITKFSYPRGRYNEITTEQVRRAGFKEARTTIVMQEDYIDKFRKPTSVHIYQRREYEGRDWLEVARSLFKSAKVKDKYFHLWGHSLEIDKYKQWKKVESFFKKLKL